MGNKFVLLNIYKIISEINFNPFFQGYCKNVNLFLILLLRVFEENSVHFEKICDFLAEKSQKRPELGLAFFLKNKKPVEVEKTPEKAKIGTGLFSQK